MPKSWLCFIALLLPLGLSLLMLHTGFVNALWYRQDYAAYSLLNGLRAQPLFLRLAGWPLLVFVVIVFSYWMVDDDRESITGQLLLLPLLYPPVTILADWIASGEFHPDTLYIHPMVLLPVGYAYVVTWTLFIWMLEKLRLVL